MAKSPYEDWVAQDVPYKDTDLAKKTFSYRFPVHIAARLAALEEMFPNKSRSEVIIGILKLGLEQMEASLPVEEKKRRATRDEAAEAADACEGDIEDYLGGYITEGTFGPKVDYINKANEHFIQLEKERGTVDPKPVFKV